jgi:hypothetical protein
VVIETLSGDSRVVNNMDFYKSDILTTRYQQRIDLYHGANNFLYIRGNAAIYDTEVLSSILNNNFIDCNNVAFDYEVLKDFTWDSKDLVEIKKRRKTLNRFFKPTAVVLNRIKNAK